MFSRVNISHVIVNKIRKNLRNSSLWIIFLLIAEFLKSSSATYLAADKLPPGPEQNAAREAEIRRQELLQQMRQVRLLCIVLCIANFC